MRKIRMRLAIIKLPIPNLIVHHPSLLLHHVQSNAITLEKSAFTIDSNLHLL